MAHSEQKAFCLKVKEKFPNFFKNKKVLDIGSLDVNGNNRDLFENCAYIGLDLGEGKNIDVISAGHEYDAPNDYFDLIISTEVFEHDIHYEKTIANVIRMLKPGGLFLFTCAAPGRPEHGTRRYSTNLVTYQDDAPFLLSMPEEWANYYKNLTDVDIKKICGFNDAFPDGHFEINNNATIPSDLYFYGIKGGIKYLTDGIIPEFKKEDFNDDIFVIDCWPDNEPKENDLINLIKRFKIFNIPILLTGHYPIKPEIQKMVDYYIFDKNNPLIFPEEYEKYEVHSCRWTLMGDIGVYNAIRFHHDYAIWEAMRNSFNFCKYLGKKYIHFLEYDNLPDLFQYRQSFLENIRYNDAVLHQYGKALTGYPGKEEYCTTYLFSIRTDVAVKTIDLIKTKEEFFKNKPTGWQLERNFLTHLRKVTDKIYMCRYIDNDNELNTQAVWNRDGMLKNGGVFQLYLGVDDNDELYLHTISGFHAKDALEDYLIEVAYCNQTKFFIVEKGKFGLFNLGKYKKGYSVKIYYQGVEVFSEFLGDDVKKYWNLNKVTNNALPKPQTDMKREININFIDGPFCEIKESAKKKYNVQFINARNNKTEFEINLPSNHWARCSKKYYADWIIKIKGIDNDFYYEHKISPENKRILIGFESKSLGDTLAWLPYVEKFRIEKKCHVICSTFHNNLFKGQYPNIEFVEPGTNVNDIYGLYRIGVFYKDGKVDFERHKTDPKNEPLMKVGSDILGLDYVELKPNLPIFATEKKKVVSIASHATAQCKYWNNPNGWQDVVDFLTKKGYEVKLLSSEGDGYMGNKSPKNVSKVPPGKIENVIKLIQESELFIGISSGLSWLSWAAGTETILISGFTDVYLEPMNGVRRIINKDVCNSCWHKFNFGSGDWNWCPVHKGTDRQFECSKAITSEQVIEEIKSALKLTS